MFASAAISPPSEDFSPPLPPTPPQPPTLPYNAPSSPSSLVSPPPPTRRGRGRGRGSRGRRGTRGRAGSRGSRTASTTSSSSSSSSVFSFDDVLSPHHHQPPPQPPLSLLPALLAAAANRNQVSSGDGGGGGGDGSVYSTPSPLLFPFSPLFSYGSQAKVEADTMATTSAEEKKTVRSKRFRSRGEEKDGIGGRKEALDWKFSLSLNKLRAYLLPRFRFRKRRMWIFFLRLWRYQSPQEESLSLSLFESLTNLYSIFLPSCLRAHPLPVSSICITLGSVSSEKSFFSSQT